MEHKNVGTVGHIGGAGRSLGRFMAGIAASVAPSPPTANLARRRFGVRPEPDPANCPVCGIEHRTGKIACCAEHGRAYRAERRHHSLPAKNGVKGRRHGEIGFLRWADRAGHLTERPHAHLAATNQQIANPPGPDIPMRRSEEHSDDDQYQLAT